MVGILRLRELDCSLDIFHGFDLVTTIFHHLFCFCADDRPDKIDAGYEDTMLKQSSITREVVSQNTANNIDNNLTESDDDDDVVIGSSVSLTNYRNNRSPTRVYDKGSNRSKLDKIEGKNEVVDKNDKAKSKKYSAKSSDSKDLNDEKPISYEKSEVRRPSDYTSSNKNDQTKRKRNKDESKQYISRYDQRGVEGSRKWSSKERLPDESKSSLWLYFNKCLSVQHSFQIHATQD